MKPTKNEELINRIAEFDTCMNDCDISITKLEKSINEIKQIKAEIEIKRNKLIDKIKFHNKLIPKP